MSKADLIEKLFKIKGVPLKLYPYQRKWVQDESRFRVLNKSRQVGMSYALAAETLVDTIFNDANLTLIISTGERASQNVMNYIWNLYYSMDLPLRSKLVLKEKSKTSLKFKFNGSKIISLPNSPSTVRGYMADHVKLDEFAFFEHEDKMWESVTPMISRGGRMSIISTPFGTLNRFHKIYVEGENDEEDVWSRHRVHHTECPDLDIKDIQKTMTKTQFLQEYCCQFVDRVTSAIPMELILQCIDEELRMKTGLDDMKEGARVIGGIDFAKIEDRTAISLFEEKMVKGVNVYTQIYLHTMKGNFDEQLKHIRRLITLFNIKDLWVDMTGTGEKLTEDLIKYSNCVHGISFSRQSKERMVADVVSIMQAKRVKLLNDIEQIKEMHSLRREVTPHNNVVFRHASGDHDDIFWANALALSNATRYVKGSFPFGSFNSS